MCMRERRAGATGADWKNAYWWGAQCDGACITLQHTATHCNVLQQPGDDMRKVGELFESDWLSLWALNVNLHTFDPPAYTEVLIGREYEVQAGDTLDSIAKEFGLCPSSPFNPSPNTRVSPFQDALSLSHTHTHRHTHMHSYLAHTHTHVKEKGWKASRESVSLQHSWGRARVWVCSTLGGRECVSVRHSSGWERERERLQRCWGPALRMQSDATAVVWSKE